MTTALESRQQLWVELLVLEALVGTNTLEALEGLDVVQSDDGFVMSNCEVKSLFDGLRWMASGSPVRVLFDVFYEIPHSYLEYGTGVNG